MSPASQKRQYGTYYTEYSPFELEPFKRWARAAGLDGGGRAVLEPFAGSNNIVRMLQDAGIRSKFACYDIAAGKAARCRQEDGGGGRIRTRRRDTLKSFPTGYRACVTNPPWLARNSARRRGLRFDIPDRYDDMYKYALELALQNCGHVAFIIPATFLRSGLFRDRLYAFVQLERRLFTDTANPVCLALFSPRPRRAQVWSDNCRIGYLDDLEGRYNINAHLGGKTRHDVRFNAKGGGLGLYAVDNTKEASIRFCHGSDLGHRTVKHTDRSITRIDPGVRVTSGMIDDLNRTLGRFRDEMHDVFLAPFKGLREDGRYRRRLDFAAARGIISRCLPDAR